LAHRTGSGSICRTAYDLDIERDRLAVVQAGHREGLLKLEAEGQRAIVDPQSNEIQSAVSRLSLPDRKFLILSRSETSYVQVMIVDLNRLALECRNGSPERHYRSARDDFSASEVVEILEAYRRGEDSWWNENEWRLIDVSARQDIWDRVSLFSAIAAFVLIFDSAIALKQGHGDPIFGLEAMEVLSIAFVALMVSAIIDLRRFRTMDPMGRVRAIGTIGVGVMVVTIQCIESLTAR
jgi:hypothetical protein